MAVANRDVHVRDVHDPSRQLSAVQKLSPGHGLEGLLGKKKKVGWSGEEAMVTNAGYR